MEERSISYSQALALVRSGELRAIKIGGRGVWRVTLDAFENYIAERYAETAAMARAESSGTAESLRSRWSRKWSPPVLIAWGRSVFFTRPSRRRDNLCPTVRDIGCWTAPGLSWYREALGSERRGAGSVILGDLRPISRQVCLDRTVAEGVQLRAAVDEAPGGIQPLGEHRDLW